MRQPIVLAVTFSVIVIAWSLAGCTGAICPDEGFGSGFPRSVIATPQDVLDSVKSLASDGMTIVRERVGGLDGWVELKSATGQRVLICYRAEDANRTAVSVHAREGADREAFDFAHALRERIMRRIAPDS